MRTYSNDIISAVEDGFLTWEEVAMACLKYMSEDEVEDLVVVNQWVIATDEKLDLDSIDKTEILDFIYDHTQLSIDFENHFDCSYDVEGNLINEPGLDEIIAWLQEHDQAWEDFIISQGY